MTRLSRTRRTFLAAGAVTAGAALTGNPIAPLRSAHAQGLAPTPTMRGGPTTTAPAPRSSNASVAAAS